MSKVFRVLILIILILPIGSCFDGPWTDILENVPYFPQNQTNYCVLACIQMWAWYDGNTHVTQDMIANYIGIAEFGTFPEQIVEGVNFYTESAGYLLEKYKTNIGQDQCIAACIASIKDFTPAIMPFKLGFHAVLAIGYTWHYEDGMRVADKMYCHDPNPTRGPMREVSASVLKIAEFAPFGNRYYVVLGKRKYRDDGIDGYNTFISEGGTFYGGPKDYNPFTFDPFTTY